MTSVEAAGKATDPVAAIDRSALDLELIAAHEAGDRKALVQLYRRAGGEREAAGDIDAACFYYTHAYVFALESGDPAKAELLAKLVEYGRDEAA